MDGQETQGNEGDGRDCGGRSSISVGQVLVVVRESKEEILENARVRDEKLRTEIFERLDAIEDRIIQKLTSNVCMQSTETRSTGTRGKKRTEKAKKEPVNPDTVPFLKEVANADRAVIPHLQWLMLSTLLSFKKGQSNAKLWLNEELLDRTMGAADAVGDVSGISLIFFRVPRTETRVRYTGRIASAWSYVIRKTVVAMVMSTKKSVDGSGSRVPDWLLSFGGRRKMTSIVDEVFSRVERRGIGQCEESEASRGSKRRRTDDGEERDKYYGEREAAVKAARMNVMHMLTNGRTEARKQLFLGVLFLVEKIFSFDTVEEAKGQGYEFVLPETGHGEPFEVCDLQVNAGSRWNIPSSGTGEEDISNTDRENLSAFEKMQNDFPELTITLKYKKKVRQRRSSANPRESAENEDQVFWSVSENVSLHTVASSVILGAYKVDSFQEILRSCELSLCVIHVFACGLRGLIRKSIGLPLDALERIALGDVSAKLSEKGSVIAMYGGSTREKDDGSENDLAKMRRAKFEMSMEQYEAEKAKIMAASSSQRESFCSQTEQQDSDDDDDEDDDWMFKIGKRNTRHLS